MFQAISGPAKSTDKFEFLRHSETKEKKIYNKKFTVSHEWKKIILCFPTKNRTNIEQNKLREAQPMSHV